MTGEQTVAASRSYGANELHPGQRFRRQGRRTVYMILDTMGWNVSPADTGYTLAVVLDSPPRVAANLRPGTIHQINNRHHLEVVEADETNPEAEVRAMFPDVRLEEHPYGNPQEGRTVYRLAAEGTHILPATFFYDTPANAWGAAAAMLRGLVPMGPAVETTTDMNQQLRTFVPIQSPGLGAAGPAGGFQIGAVSPANIAAAAGALEAQRQGGTLRERLAGLPQAERDALFQRYAQPGETLDTFADRMERSGAVLDETAPTPPAGGKTYGEDGEPQPAETAPAPRPVPDAGPDSIERGGWDGTDGPADNGPSAGGGSDTTGGGPAPGGGIGEP